MRQRFRRAVQVERNRGDVLDAARRVFLEKGYAGASLEAIADAAGFSKGVVYSQFDSKADLFLALLERRIDERAAENERIASGVKGAAGLAALIAGAERAFTGDPAWALLVAEFRVQAARAPELNRRYAALHARTVERLAQSIAATLERAGVPPLLDPAVAAQVVLAFGLGIELERTVSSGALPMSVVGPALLRALGIAPPRALRGVASKRAPKA